MRKLRIVFMGTGDIALPSFQSLLNADEGQDRYELVALVTQPDKPVGRKQVLTAPAIKELALAHGIPVMQPERAKDKVFLAELEAMKPDELKNLIQGTRFDEYLRVCRDSHHRR